MWNSVWWDLLIQLFSIGLSWEISMFLNFCREIEIRIPYYRSNDVCLVVYRVNRLLVQPLQSTDHSVAAVDGRADFLAYSRRKHDVTSLLTTDAVGLGLPSDNNFQPVTSFVSIAMLGNDIVVGVTFLGYGGKRVTMSLRIHLPGLLGSIQTAGYHTGAPPGLKRW